MATRAHLYTSSGQAPYRSFRRKRQNSFILLPLLSPQSFATLRGPHEALCALPRAETLHTALPCSELGGVAANRENCIFPATACAVYPFAHLPRGNALPPQAILSRQVRTSETEVIPSQSTIAASRSSAGKRQIRRSRCRLPKRRKADKRVGRSDPRLHEKGRRCPFGNTAPGTSHARFL